MCNEIDFLLFGFVNFVCGEFVLSFWLCKLYNVNLLMGGVDFIIGKLFLYWLDYLVLFVEFLYVVYGYV